MLSRGFEEPPPVRPRNSHVGSHPSNPGSVCLSDFPLPSYRVTPQGTLGYVSVRGETLTFPLADTPWGISGHVSASRKPAA